MSARSHRLLHADIPVAEPPVVEYVAPAPSSSCAAPAPVIKYGAPARPQANFDFSGLVNPQFSTVLVEAFTLTVASVSLSRLEQTVAGEVLDQEQTVLERIERKIGNIPVSLLVEDTVEVVQSFPQERLQQRTVDQEQMFAEEMTLNVASFQPVQEQVKV